MSGRREVLRAVADELRKPAAFLVPLRLFIGFGWVRAAAEKLIEPGWYDGSQLTAFLQDQLAWSQEAFPFYGWLMENLFMPQATALGVVVMLGQLVIGLAILTGFATSVALLAGIVLNVNFLLAGVPNPSAFYIVIQLVLLFGGAGTVLGADAHLARRARHPVLATLSGRTPASARALRRVYGTAAAACLALTLATLPFVSTLDPALIVEDPAMILVTMFLVAAAMSGIRAVTAGGASPA